MPFRRRKPLDECPDLRCRRAQTCLVKHPEFHCRKFNIGEDERRYEIADKLEQFQKERLRDLRARGIKPKRPANVDPEEAKTAVYYMLLQIIAQRRAAEGKPVPVMFIPEAYKLKD